MDKCCATCTHFAARADHEIGICMASSPHPVRPGWWAYPETESHDGETCDAHTPAAE